MLRFFLFKKLANRWWIFRVSLEAYHPTGIFSYFFLPSGFLYFFLSFLLFSPWQFPVFSFPFSSSCKLISLELGKQGVTKIGGKPVLISVVESRPSYFFANQSKSVWLGFACVEYVAHWGKREKKTDAPFPAFFFPPVCPCVRFLMPTPPPPLQSRARGRGGNMPTSVSHMTWQQYWKKIQHSKNERLRCEPPPLLWWSWKSPLDSDKESKEEVQVDLVPESEEPLLLLRRCGLQGDLGGRSAVLSAGRYFLG